ncbi:epithelial-stromal interaction protein 1 isoform X7 [Canis lupus dingo]|uniref:epithelial-stromal interaction protein 1 isoform X7 n=1 Tax=Canis lupus dingo TaxID=286419 RepID=UPI0020C28DB4|nr:epithelial-stromal interaction protein 1 isoform X7 [Canis lupus dingo]
MFTRTHARGPRTEPGPPQGPRPGVEGAPRSPAEDSPGPAARRPPGAYTMIAPNENRRSQIQRIAEQELKNLEKWKEQHRAKPVNLVPRRLGGSQSEAEVRQKQQLQVMQSKYQQKLKREESVRIKKEAEEAQIQKMKAIQREKARSWAYKDSLKEEENKKLQKMKEEQHQKSELLEFNQQQQEEARTKIHQAEHRRVNNVFLDRLQGKSQPGGLEHFGGHWNMNSGNSWDV